MSSFQALPGFRDFYPESMALRNYIVDTWKKVAHKYGFVEYDGPPLESLELIVKKSGEEIISQLFNFVDKGERAVTLRAEMTPTLARMVGAREAAYRKPIRWFAVPQLFRYEKPQKGRLREHFQFNMDIFGETTSAADAELIAAAIDTLRAFGLTDEDFVARISDRRIFTTLLVEKKFNEEQRSHILAVIDKWEREPREVCQQKLSATGLSAEDISWLERLLSLRDLAQLRAFCNDETLSEQARTNLAQVCTDLEDIFARLQAMGLESYARLDLTIVRGLAYYTGMVFECFDKKGEFRAICGGGRYDTLLENLGYAPMPALGFGMGDVVLGELLKARGLAPAYKENYDLFIAFVTPELEKQVVRLAHAAREHNVRAIYPLKYQKVGKQLQAAAQSGVRFTLILGPDEFERGAAKLKNMQTSEEKEILLDDFLKNPCRYLS